MVMNLVTQKNGVQQRLMIQGHILEMDKEIGETVTVTPKNLHLMKVTCFEILKCLEVCIEAQRKLRFPASFA